MEKETAESEFSAGEKLELERRYDEALQAYNAAAELFEKLAAASLARASLCRERAGKLSKAKVV